ncbi:hypothetical protein [Frankia gtarii]|nr:hypothetical protein [Frankia gtarii]
MIRSWLIGSRVMADFTDATVPTGVPNRADPHIIWLRIGTYGIYR